MSVNPALELQQCPFCIELIPSNSIYCCYCGNKIPILFDETQHDDAWNTEFEHYINSKDYETVNDPELPSSYVIDELEEYVIGKELHEEMIRQLEEKYYALSLQDAKQLSNDELPYSYEYMQSERNNYDNVRWHYFYDIDPSIYEDYDENDFEYI